MSFIANVLPLSLEQYLSQNLQGKQLPVTFNLSEQALDFDERPLNINLNQDTIELVVFQQLCLAQLLALQSHAQLEILALTTINHRNNQTSCRFQVSCSDFILARKALADFTLANDIEAALLRQVPTLSEPGLLVMDMDSTTIEIECIDEIAKLAGVGEEVAIVTERAMLGELDFAQSLHQRVATLANSPEKILSDVVNDIPLMAGLKPLISELKKHNWRIAIASGGFTYFADHLKESLNLDAAFANTLEIVDGKLTGKVLGDVVDAQVKADSLAILSKEYQIPKNQTVAMGDGANDLVMMAAASFGVAFHAKPIVLTQADSTINIQGLDCLLHWLA
ncbi:phosphoserine phosphatase SerB [Colwellia psychrerythraea]|uniref:Phosphoserine phosphatase n=1 Tax=Colwellia psychrerythraea TaxID=28229 RepID=A0A099KHN2_COLPS|nr:phosphoserine phosphatase SerB [Colwellia psychrerythraea]KGJ89507.1 phosphoserine phosphatase SerB [Colwellia psychrerythraea]